jgi:hypothetical protein
MDAGDHLDGGIRYAVVDQVWKPPQECPPVALVDHGKGLGPPLDRRVAGIHCSEELMAESLCLALVPVES